MVIADAPQPGEVTALPPVSLPSSFRHPDSSLAPVRDQGGCAACWSFVIADVGFNALCVARACPPEALSSQFLLSCWTGAKGSCPLGAVPEYVIDHPLLTEKGIPLASFQPYVAKDSAPCPMVGEEIRYKVAKGSLKNLAWPVLNFLPRIIRQPIVNRNVENMKCAILRHSVIGTINVHRALYEWDFDLHPVYAPRDDELGGFVGAHAVELIGWTPTTWIARTSWGPNFGRRGVFEIPLGENFLGIESRAMTFDMVPPAPSAASVASGGVSVTAPGTFVWANVLDGGALFNVPVRR